MKETFDKLDLAFGSELPTHVNPARAAAAARVAARAVGTDANAHVEGERAEAEPVEQETWCDSEAPTNVAAERPLLPRPPRAPRV